MRFHCQPNKTTLCIAGFFHSIASSVSMVLTSMNLAYNINEPWSGQIWATLVAIGVMIVCDSIKTTLTITPPACIVPDVEQPQQEQEH